MGTLLFTELGEHCAKSDCKQLDFLPFNCDACQEVFCLEHRKYAAHECPKADTKADTNIVLLCPLCAKPVKLTPNQTPDQVLETHLSSTSCDPSHYEKAHKKPRCPVKGCKELLTYSNTVKCKDCHVDVCLRHRYASEHKCERALVGGDAKKGASGPGLKLLEKLGARPAHGCAQEMAKEKGGLKGGAKAGSIRGSRLFNMWSY